MDTKSETSYPKTKKQKKHVLGASILAASINKMASVSQNKIELAMIKLQKENLNQEKTLKAISILRDEISATIYTSLEGSLAHTWLVDELSRV